MAIYTPSDLNTSAASNVYISTGNTVVTWLSLCNYSAANVTANVYVVPSGGSASNTNAILGSFSIPANDTYQVYGANEKLVLGNGDMIKANCSANSNVSVTVSYTGF